MSIKQLIVWILTVVLAYPLVSWVDSRFNNDAWYGGRITTNTTVYRVICAIEVSVIIMLGERLIRK